MIGPLSTLPVKNRRAPPIIAQYTMRNGLFVANKGGAPAITRASVEGSQDAYGAWKEALNNQSLTLSGLGLVIFVARTSRIKCNQRTSGGDGTALGIGGVGSAGWTLQGTAAIAPEAVVAPDGTLTAEEASGVGASGVNDIVQTNSGFSNNGVLATSVWIKRISLSGTLRVVNPQNANIGDWSVNLANLPNDWVRLYAGSPYVTVTNVFKASATGTAGLGFYASAGAPVSFQIWRSWQVEAPAPGPDYEVGNVASYAVPATVVSASLPSITDPALCTKAVFIIPVSRPGGTIFALGTNAAVNSCLFSIGNSADANAYAKVTGSDGVERQGYWAHGWSAGSRHTVVMSPNPAGGIPRIYADGTAVTLTDAGGLGTGQFSAFPTGSLYIGQRSTGIQANAYIEEVSIYQTSDPTRCL